VACTTMTLAWTFAGALSLTPISSSAQCNRDRTVITLGRLANIAPLVLEENNALPEAGKAHVRLRSCFAFIPALSSRLTE
jgi:hypothetical protein